MRYLVTGGAGFIGSHLVHRLLEQGHHVRVLDNLSTGARQNLPPKAEFLHGDILRLADVASALADMDGCFHLAAISSVELSNRQPEHCRKVNVEGTSNVFSAAGASLPVVYASSAAVYGDGELPLREDAAPRPLTVYGIGKLDCERNAQIHPGLRGAGVRIFNCYGAREHADSIYGGVINKFIRRLAAREPLTFHGDGNQTRDFIAVADVAGLWDMLMQALHRGTPVPPIVNACTGVSVSIHGLAQMLAALMQVPLAFECAPHRDGDILHSRGDPALAAQHFGWRAATSLKAGLQAMLAR